MSVLSLCGASIRIRRLSQDGEFQLRFEVPVTTRSSNYASKALSRFDLAIGQIFLKFTDTILGDFGSLQRELLE